MERPNPNHNKFEAGGSVVALTARWLGEIAQAGFGLARVAVDGTPQLFDPEIGLLARHRPENNVLNRQ